MGASGSICFASEMRIAWLILRKRVPSEKLSAERNSGGGMLVAQTIMAIRRILYIANGLGVVAEAHFLALASLNDAMNMRCGEPPFF